MTDLVKRLREYRVGCGLHCSAYDTREPLDECIEAANRIEKLEAALRPFAKWADAYEPDEGDDHLEAWDHAPTIGMLRAARKALEGKDG